MHGCARCGQVSRPASRTLIPPPGTRSNAGGAPFLRHAFLAALENSRCVGAGTGWQPVPITLHDERGLAAAAPAYVKTHSFGEFVFDFSPGRRPMRNTASPTTRSSCSACRSRPPPARGCWCVPISMRGDARSAGRSRSSAFAESAQLFLDPRAVRRRGRPRSAAPREGWLARQDVQFHWHNRGYRDFEHYLEGFTAEKRKKAQARAPARGRGRHRRSKPC